MKTVTIDIDRARCKACELCISFCPEGVLALSSGEFNALGYQPAIVVKPDACTGCAHCARMCPEAAITIAVHLPQVRPAAAVR